MPKTQNLIGKHVIVRSNMAGVFFGILAKKTGQELTLQKARKFYYFSGANTVEDLAIQGALNSENCKLTIEVDELVISEYVQIIPCTEEAINNNKKIKTWKFQK